MQRVINGQTRVLAFRIRPHLPGIGSGPLVKPGLGAVTHGLGVGWGDAWPAVGGEIMVGHQKPLVTGLALPEALDWLVYE